MITQHMFADSKPWVTTKIQECRRKIRSSFRIPRMPEHMRTLQRLVLLTRPDGQNTLVFAIFFHPFINSLWRQKFVTAFIFGVCRLEQIHTQLKRETPHTPQTDGFQARNRVMKTAFTYQTDGSQARNIAILLLFNTEMLLV